MRLSGFAFLALAVALAVHAHSPGTFNPRDAAPTVYSEHPPESEKPDLGTRPPRSFAIDGAMMHAAGHAEAGKEPVLKSVAERAAIRSARSEAHDEVAVAVALPVASKPAPVAVAEAVTPATDEGKVNVARAIKKELKRVGCFGGRIDEDWDSAAKAATEQFLDRVNATLPNRPDHVLLTLVRNHRAVACGDVCPQGQALSGEGRCMPNAIIAKLTRKAPVNVAEAAKPAASLHTTVASSEVRPSAGKVDASAMPDATSKRSNEGAKQVATAAPPAKAWWETFLTPSGSETAPAKEQTLDRPVGLTHVPQPRPAAVQNSTTTPGSSQPIVNLAAAEVAIERNSGGLSDTSGLRPNRVQEPQDKARPRRAARSSVRSYRARSYRPPPPRYARRWSSGRNVQTMFMHPLGRM